MAHVLNDEVSRKYIQSVKRYVDLLPCLSSSFVRFSAQHTGLTRFYILSFRLLTFAQTKYPPAGASQPPSRRVPKTSADDCSLILLPHTRCVAVDGIGLRCMIICHYVPYPRRSTTHLAKARSSPPSPLFAGVTHPSLSSPPPVVPLLSIRGLFPLKIVL